MGRLKKFSATLDCIIGPEPDEKPENNYNVIIYTFHDIFYEFRNDEDSVVTQIFWQARKHNRKSQTLIYVRELQVI